MHPLYRRLRAVACKAWGMPPSEFDRQAAVRDILLCDIVDLMHVLMCDPTAGMGVLQYLAPGSVRRANTARTQAVRAGRNNAMVMLLATLATPKSDEEAAFIERLKAAGSSR